MDDIKKPIIKFMIETIIYCVILLLILSFALGFFVGTKTKPEIIKINLTNQNETIIIYNNTIEQKEYIIDTCNYQVLQKEYEMYKEQVKIEYNLINACKEGMIK